MRYFLYFGAFLALVFAGLLIAGQLGLLRGTAPSDLGVKDGRLKQISDTPNSVSSQARLWAGHPMVEYAMIAPFSVKGDAAQEIARLVKVLSALPNTVIVQYTSNYIYAQSTSAVFKFTDDIEFYLDTQQQVIHVRSASRLGRKDFGVNRQRVEHIRAAMSQ